jgi:uncharacterized protein with PIN domain
MADQNAWMRAGEPSLDPPDEDGRRCPSCDAVLQDTREDAHGEEWPSRVKGERCPTPDCPDYMEDD